MRTRALTTAALLVAVGVVLFYLFAGPLSFLGIGIWLGAPWLQFNPSDVPTLLGTFALGPVFGGIISLLRAFISNVTLGSGGMIGFFMDGSSTFVLAVSAGAIYHFRRTRAGAVLAIVIGSIAMTAVTVAINFFWAYPAFGVPRELVWTTALPFNLIKCAINGLIVFLIYKPLSGVMQGRRSDKRQASTED